VGATGPKLGIVRNFWPTTGALQAAGVMAQPTRAYRSIRRWVARRGPNPKTTVSERGRFRTRRADRAALKAQFFGPTGPTRPLKGNQGVTGMTGPAPGKQRQVAAPLALYPVPTHLPPGRRAPQGSRALPQLFLITVQTAPIKKKTNLGTHGG